MDEMDNSNKKLNWSKYVVGVHQLAAFEDYLMKVTEEELQKFCEELVALNACLLGMHPITLERGEFIN